MKRFALALFTCVPFFYACGTEKGEELDYDPALLAQYRAALPTKDALEARDPKSTSGSRAVGDDALFPQWAGPVAEGVNGAVTGIVDLMQLIVAFPPTVYNSETKEFFWGPYPNQDDFGYWAAYIRENPPEDDLRYGYALLRGASNDVATLTPVIFGGATRGEEEDYGSGITAWDFDANYAFAVAHDPDYASKDFARGGFAAAYGRKHLPDEDEDGASDGDLALNLAVFADFVPEENPGAEPLDGTYLYGRFAAAFTVDFLHFRARFDVEREGEQDGNLEDVDIRLAFLNEGTGRAEANVVGGSLSETQSITSVECWDGSIDQRYFTMDLYDGDAEPVSIALEGTLENCDAPFGATLDEIDVPSLDGVDPSHIALLTALAEDVSAVIAAQED